MLRKWVSLYLQGNSLNLINWFKYSDGMSFGTRDQGFSTFSMNPLLRILDIFGKYDIGSFIKCLTNLGCISTEILYTSVSFCLRLIIFILERI